MTNNPLVADLHVPSFSFASTQITVEALTPAGREFLGAIAGTCGGVAPSSVTLPKSRGADLAEFAERKGLRVS